MDFVEKKWLKPMILLWIRSAWMFILTLFGMIMLFFLNLCKSFYRSYVPAIYPHVVLVRREAAGSYAENQKITAVRKVYQRAIVTPMTSVELLWKDYCAYETVDSIYLSLNILSKINIFWVFLRVSIRR